LGCFYRPPAVTDLSHYDTPAYGKPPAAKKMRPGRLRILGEFACRSGKKPAIDAIHMTSDRGRKWSTIDQPAGDSVVLHPQAKKMLRRRNEKRPIAFNLDRGHGP
jgi:hypothetical protein